MQGQTQAWSPRGTGVMVSVRSQTPEGSGRADHSVLTRTPAPPPPPRRLQHPSGAWGPPARLGATSCPQVGAGDPAFLVGLILKSMVSELKCAEANGKGADAETTASQGSPLSPGHPPPFFLANRGKIYVT